MKIVKGNRVFEIRWDNGYITTEQGIEDSTIAYSGIDEENNLVKFISKVFKMDDGSPLQAIRVTSEQIVEIKALKPKPIIPERHKKDGNWKVEYAIDGEVYVERFDNYAIAEEVAKRNNVKVEKDLDKPIETDVLPYYTNEEKALKMNEYLEKLQGYPMNEED